MLRTFSVVIFISTIVGVVLKLCTYMLFTYMHFVIYVMFNVLYRSRLSCHVGEINACFELFGHGNQQCCTYGTGTTRARHPPPPPGGAGGWRESQNSRHNTANMPHNLILLDKLM